jgi:RNA polymerase sigma factor (TIGR02999 family)
MLYKLLRELMNSSDTYPIAGPSAEDLGDVCTTAVPADAPIGAGEDEVRSLVEALYPELRRIAQAHMRRERSDHTLQPTALVSEAFMKLAGQPGFRWRDRSHFLFSASKAMRLLLIDHARRHAAEKHGGGLSKVQLDEAHAADADESMEYLDLHELLKKMSEIDQRMASVVELRVFGGLTFREIGEILGTHERTVKRDWQLARAWLFGKLRRGNDSWGVGTDQDSL